MSSPFQGALPPLSQSSDLPEMWVLLGCVVLASCLVVSLERQPGSGDLGRHGPRGGGGSQRGWWFPEGGRRRHCVLMVRGREGALLAGVPVPTCPSVLSLLRVLWALLSPLCPLLATGSTVQETCCPGEGLGWGNQRCHPTFSTCLSSVLTWNPLSSAHKRGRGSLASLHSHVRSHVSLFSFGRIW